MGCLITGYGSMPSLPQVIEAYLHPLPINQQQFHLHGQKNSSWFERPRTGAELSADDE